MPRKLRASSPSIPVKVGTTSAPQLAPSIIIVRGERVILSGDLAQVYGVPTKALNQAVRRNAERFPLDFVFKLTIGEARRLANLRSQSVTLGWGRYSKYAPLAFTEHGAVMAAAVLNSPRAIEMSLFVVRAFLQLRRMVAGQSQLATQLAKLERRVTAHDHELKAILTGLRRLMASPVEPPRRRIGFA